MDRYAAVIVPTHIHSQARYDYFERCLKSLACQDYPTIGIVVDDGSPIDIKPLVKQYAQDANLRYVRRSKADNDSGSSSDAMNLGIDLLLDEGDILRSVEKDSVAGICYAHSDDLLAPNSIGKRISVLGRSSFAYSRMIQIDGNDAFVRIKDCGDVPDTGVNQFPHHTTMWSEDFLRRLRGYVQEEYGHQGVFDTTLYAAEDRDVSLSAMELLVKRGEEPVHSSDFSYIYRIQDDSITAGLSVIRYKLASWKINNKHGLRTLNYLDDVFGDLPWSLFTFLPESVKKPLRKPRDMVKGIFKKESYIVTPEQEMIDGILAEALK